MTFHTRFAPSPTGLLHLGHAYSALLIGDMVQTSFGKLFLRIEDTDTARCKPEFEAAIYSDLAWLGLEWNETVWRQSERLAIYEAALEQLIDAGFCYPCSCSRGDIRNALSAPQEGQPHLTPDGYVYPGTCRHRTMSSRKPDDAIRLNTLKILSELPGVANLNFAETGPIHSGVHQISAERLEHEIGDIVLARRDIRTASYHLSVVVDDGAQGVTDVIRGTDLFEATFIHRLLQALLNLPTPTYHHHRLIRDENGRRLAKRDDARAIQTYRDAGKTPDDISAMLGL